MANDDDVVSQMRLHQECWELLPWVVNGRLSSPDAARVREHLHECTRCSEELHAQQQLCEAIRRDDALLLAPQASLQKIWQRFDGAAAPARSAARQPAPAAAHESDPAAGMTPALMTPALMTPALMKTGPARRVRVAMAAQALLIVGLLGLVSWQTFERWQAPRFVTLTAPVAASAGGAAVRVVFVPTAAMRDVNELLSALHAQLLAGPNSAGVFTLGLPEGANADAVAVQLRNHPHVQFAESIPTTPVQP